MTFSHYKEHYDWWKVKYWIIAFCWNYNGLIRILIQNKNVKFNVQCLRNIIKHTIVGVNLDSVFTDMMKIYTQYVSLSESTILTCFDTFISLEFVIQFLPCPNLFLVKYVVEKKKNIICKNNKTKKLYTLFYKTLRSKYSPLNILNSIHSFSNFCVKVYKLMNRSLFRSCSNQSWYHIFQKQFTCFLLKY